MKAVLSDPPCETLDGAYPELVEPKGLRHDKLAREVVREVAS